MAIRIRFTKAKKSVRPKRRTQRSLDLLAKLNSYLAQTEPQTVRFLVRNLQGVQNAVTYQELREAYLSGGIMQSQFEEWQKRYSILVTETLRQKWIEAAEQAAREEQEKYPFVYEPAKSTAMEWIRDHGAELVTNLAQEQMYALNAMVFHFSGYTAVSPDEAAQQIRACIGLTKPQALANLRYYTTVKEEYLKQHPRGTVEAAERKAREAAARYAGRQHRYRAQCIARTELVYGYNAGLYGATKDAQAQGYIGSCQKRWVTAHDNEKHNRVCSVCAGLDGESVDMDACFSNGKLMPPDHPQCRCVMDFIEVSPPIIPTQVDNGGRGGIIKSDKQFGKKVGKHAEDYGLDPTNPDDRQTMGRIINEIYDFPDEVRTGKWRGYDGDVDFSIKGEDVVVSQNGKFITILKGGVSNARIKNAGKREI